MSSLREQKVYERLTKYVRERDFSIDLALGRVPGASQDFMAGFCPTVNTANGEITIMDYTPARRMVFPTGPVNVFVSSTSASDVGRDVAILGLLADFTPVIETVTLNGQTPVQLSNQLRHVQTARMVGALNVGGIFVSRTSATTAGTPNNLNDMLSYIIAGKGITRNGWYMVPKGMSGAGVAIRGGTDNPTKPAQINTYIKFDGDIPLQTVSYSVNTAFPQYLFPSPIAANSLLGSTSKVFPEGALLEYTAQTQSNNTSVFFGLDVVLFSNGEFGGFAIS